MLCLGRLPHPLHRMKGIVKNSHLRVITAVGLIGAIFVLAVWFLDWDSAFLLAWDVGILAWLLLTFRYMTQSTARTTALSAQRAEPSTVWMLIVVTITASLGLFGSIVLASRSGERNEFEQALHLLIGVLAVAEAWLMVHTQFALYYAQCYYDEVTDNASEGNAAGESNVSHPNDRTSLLPFRKGLAFPDADEVDYWDFVYYSYTIAMCYQTSDVTVTMPTVRRITIIHALISFAFVVTLLGFSVNAISNLF